MSSRERVGQLLVLAYSALVLLVSAGVIGLYVATRGPDRLPAQAVRFLITAALCVWLYRGSLAARRVMACLLGGAGLVALLGVSGGDPVATALTGGMAAVYLSFAVVVVASPSVAAFLARQRDIRAGAPGRPEPVAGAGGVTKEP